MADREQRSRPQLLREIAAVFTRLGWTAFGGPAAHIALMEEELVGRRGWVSRQHFLDLLAATHLIPGPNSTEMALHLGHERGGRPGLLVAGACFLAPSILSTLALAWLYARWGTLPAAGAWLAGVQPVVLALIATAVWRLGARALRSLPNALVAAATAAAVLAGLGELQALLGGGALGVLLGRPWRRPPATALLALAPARPETAGVAAAATAAAGVSLWQLGAFFLKVGAVLYGSGYVLVAFLEGGLVERHGWLSQQQLLDAVGAGQLTPGPVLATAAFAGFLIAGWSGAAVSTCAIFLPSFAFVLALNPLIPRLRRSAWMAALLDAVQAAAVALMATVVVRLGTVSLTDWPALVIGCAALALGLRWRIGGTWLVLGGALAGRLLAALV